MPDYAFEKDLIARGLRVIAGVDEVGRGPLAGPVVAAAVILDPKAIPDGLDDSKRLSKIHRAALEALLIRSAKIGLGSASVEEIDRINILQATYLAMHRAIDALPCRPDHLLIDGNRLPPGLPCPATPLIKGDSRSVSIAAASIIAKNHRDQGMVDLAQQHPQYGWDRNVGYGTAEHMLALKCHGATLHHRRSFKPVHNILLQEE